VPNNFGTSKKIAELALPSSITASCNPISQGDNSSAGNYRKLGCGGNEPKIKYLTFLSSFFCLFITSVGHSAISFWSSSFTNGFF